MKLVRFVVSLPVDVLAAVEAYRFTAQQKTRNAAVRRLIEAGLGMSGAAVGNDPGHKRRQQMVTIPERGEPT